MPRRNLPRFKNLLTGLDVGMGQLPDTRIRQLNSLPVHEHNICDAHGRLKAQPSIIDIEQDADPRKFPAHTGAFTSGLAPCVAVCVYGWKDPLHRATFRTRAADCQIAMAHVSSSWLSTLEDCLTLLDEDGYKYFRSCIIGGMDGTYAEDMQELSGYLGNYLEASKSGIECVVVPLLDSQGGASAVYASADGIAFHVYDETPDLGMDDTQDLPPVHPPPSISHFTPPPIQPPGVLGHPLPTLQPPFQFHTCRRCGIPVKTSEMLCFICIQFYK